MVDIVRYTETAEAGVAILNPLSRDKLLPLSELVEFPRPASQLDPAHGRSLGVARLEGGW